MCSGTKLLTQVIQAKFIYCQWQFSSQKQIVIFLVENFYQPRLAVSFDICQFFADLVEYWNFGGYNVGELNNLLSEMNRCWRKNAPKFYGLTAQARVSVVSHPSAHIPHAPRYSDTRHINTSHKSIIGE